MSGTASNINIQPTRRMDRVDFELDKTQHARFLDLLNRPLPEESSAALKRPLECKAPWES